jgi:lambda repressor-like predicted transcriptional regulator
VENNQHIALKQHQQRIAEMHPELIKAELRMKGITPAVLAETLDLHYSTVSQVIRGVGTSARVKKAIAKVLGKAVAEIWPPKSSVLRRVKASNNKTSK